MENLNKILYITEDTSVSPTKWILSWRRPEFQGGESVEIAEKDAKALLLIITEYVEQYNCPSYFDDNNLLLNCKCGKCK